MGARSGFASGFVGVRSGFARSSGFVGVCSGFARLRKIGKSKCKNTVLSGTSLRDIIIYLINIFEI